MASDRRKGESVQSYIRRKLIEVGRYDPLMFVEKAYPWKMPGTWLETEDIRKWQADIMDAMAVHLLNPETRFKPLFLSVASGHGIGKSACIGMVSTWALSCFDRPRILITANTESQLRTKTSPEIAQWVRRSPMGSEFDIDTLSIRLKGETGEQHRLDLTPWSENNTEAFQGLHAKGRLVMVIFDEASGIPAKIWEVVYGALTDEDTILIFLAFGNPTQAAGAFRDTFGKDRRLWKSWNIDSRDVEGTNKAALQAIVDKYGEDSDVARYRVKGQFPNMSDRAMVPEYLIDLAMGRHYRKDQYDFAATILTCDPAWTGSDELVIGLRQGLVYKQLEVMPRNDNDIDVGRKLANYELTHDADAVFIDQGWGQGIWSYGQTINRSWRLIPFGSASSKPGFRNKRAEMYADLVEWLRQGGALPVDQKLRDDLAGIETKPTPDGVIQLLSKEEMKKKGLPSPDRADALALSFAEPVQRAHVPISKRLGLQGSRQSGKGYIHDPFS